MQYFGLCVAAYNAKSMGHQSLKSSGEYLFVVKSFLLCSDTCVIPVFWVIPVKKLQKPHQT